MWSLLTLFALSAGHIVEVQWLFAFSCLVARLAVEKESERIRQLRTRHENSPAILASKLVNARLRTCYV